MLQSGKYLCKVLSPVNGWFGEAGENNTPFIRIPLIVTSEGQGEGERIDYQGWLTDKSAEGTARTLAKVFGWDGDIEALANQLNTGPFVGLECEIVMEEETYKEKTRTVLKWLNPVGGGGRMLDPKSSLSLAQRLSSKTKSAAASAFEPDAPPARRAPAKRPPADPDLDAPEDDIPF